MLELYQAGNPYIKPDTVIFNSVIHAWANSGEPLVGKRAEATLNQMWELHKVGDPNIKPNTVSFNSVITAWTKSRDPSAGKRAEAILD
jgi:hypothetical protein